MGNDYMVAPDVVIYRDTVTDEEINSPQVIVDDTVCKMADIRAQNGGLPILHASVSAKSGLCEVIEHKTVEQKRSV